MKNTPDFEDDAIYEGHWHSWKSNSRMSWNLYHILNTNHYQKTACGKIIIGQTVISQHIPKEQFRCKTCSKKFIKQTSHFLKGKLIELEK